jgi:hypothetical protein
VFPAAEFEDSIDHICLELFTAVSHKESKHKGNLLQSLQAASPDELRCVWQVLFVRLAWCIADDRAYWQQALSPEASAAAAAVAWPASSGGRRQLQELFSSIPSYHAQFLETLGLPRPNPNDWKSWLAPDAMLLMRRLASHVNPKFSSSSSTTTTAANCSPDSGSGVCSSSADTQLISGGRGSSSSSSSSHSASACDDFQPLSIAYEQWGWALPCPEAPLLLLELLLLELLGSKSDIVRSSTHILGMFYGRARISEAAAAEAAGAMLQEALTLLPTAVLQAAAAAGCPGLRPQPDAEDSTKTVAAGLISGCSFMLRGLLDHANARGRCAVRSRRCDLPLL